ncbi:hypothetical protein [Victivallis vadensis]|uniref:hypothetical protein n=1 Tax=Victivallis vadensis TaxID=172901 RepID=UPI002672E627|nr:hypothetical protein [Victivallis vadensis]
MFMGKKLIPCVSVAAAVFAAAAAVSAEEPANEKKILNMNQFKEYTLAQGEIYKVFVKKDDGATTVTFPSAISKIAGVNVSTDGSTDFQISAQPGGYYFNLVALREGATGTLTVVFNRKTYILYLVQNNEKAFAAVNFIGGSGSGGASAGGGGAVTPARLLSLIDMAKAYDVLSKRYPTELRDSTRFAKKATFQFEKFQMDLLEVIRFNHEDTLVFKLLLRNDTDEEILYDKFSFSVQAGNRTYYMSAADATGVMPPKSSTYAFFTITGTPEGCRNNLAADNEFRIGVTAQYMDPQPVAVEPEPNLEEPSSIPEADEKVKKIEAEFDKRLSTLLDSMEKTLARIESQEAAIQVEQPEEAALQVEEPTAVVVNGSVSQEPEEQPSAAEADAGEVEKQLTEVQDNVSWWDFSEFPDNLAFLVNWMKF